MSYLDTLRSMENRSINTDKEAEDFENIDADITQELWIESGWESTFSIDIEFYIDAIESNDVYIVYKLWVDNGHMTVSKNSLILDELLDDVPEVNCIFTNDKRNKQINTFIDEYTDTDFEVR